MTEKATTMALGKRREEQQEMWVATTNLPKSVGHIFYRKLNGLLCDPTSSHRERLLIGFVRRWRSSDERIRTGR
jgi:hypothetical protein